MQKGLVNMKAEENMSDIQILKEDNFDNATSNGVVVVDFYADWCGPCQMFAPVFLEASRAYSGRVSFAKVNTDESRELAARFKVLGIPTIVFFKDGEVAEKVTQVLGKDELYAKIDAIL